MGSCAAPARWASRAMALGGGRRDGHPVVGVPRQAPAAIEGAVDGIEAERQGRLARRLPVLLRVRRPLAREVEEARRLAHGLDGLVSAPDLALALQLLAKVPSEVFRERSMEGQPLGHRQFLDTGQERPAFDLGARVLWRL